MTEDFAAAERTALRGLLGTLKQEGLVPPEWERAVRAVPRSAYVPERIYLGDDLEPCDRADAPETWLRAVYADDSVVTQINDGEDPGEGGERWASSSASAPGIVFRMLRMAEVVAGDGALGHAGGAPYDRLVATCSVRSVPRPWLEQVRPGGVVLTPWESPWICYGLLRMTVDDAGTASGRFSPHSAFMLMRAQRADLRIFRDVVSDAHRPDESGSGLPPWRVAGDDLAAQFAMGLRLRDV
ncbi:hypothetical protein ACFY5H_21840 [Streptomyces sp. NPDC013012]|uniref:hypothetical protein n=1 Tax=Streptomyces sp. NPDC013012 TaxID=3364860 RepID=UPI003679F6AD